MSTFLHRHLGYCIPDIAYTLLEALHAIYSLDFMSTGFKTVDLKHLFSIKRNYVERVPVE